MIAHRSKLMYALSAKFMCLRASGFYTGQRKRIGLPMIDAESLTIGMNALNKDVEHMHVWRHCNNQTGVEALVCESTVAVRRR